MTKLNSHVSYVSIIWHETLSLDIVGIKLKTSACMRVLDFKLFLQDREEIVLFFEKATGVSSPPELKFISKAQSKLQRQRRLKEPRG
jgi:hypothetical protein